VTGSTETVLHEREIEMVVRAVRVESRDVRSLELAPVDPEVTLPPWTPGAHVDVVLGTGEEELIRQYSLCGDTATEDTWTIAVLRTPDSRGGSSFVHDSLGEGDRLTVRGPRNHFALSRSGRYLFIAGGIGITPLLPMIAEAEALGSDWTLVYGGRDRGAMAFLERLAPFGERVRIVPEDEEGMIDLSALLDTPRSDTLIYCCGPSGLLDAVEEKCTTWPEGSLQVERFTATEIDDSDNAEFSIVLQRSGLTLDVPADKSIYEVVRENDVSVLASCLEGICGTCETAVLDGEVIHRDAILDEAERASNTTMMICVSRCRGSRLTLDL
jgi:ferredoxin-NADP reductase